MEEAAFNSFLMGAGGEGKTFGDYLVMIGLGSEPSHAQPEITKDEILARAAKNRAAIKWKQAQGK